MLSASLFGLIGEGLAVGTPLEILTGMGAGILLVLVARDVLMDSDINPRTYEEADFKKLVLILGILTVHSFPEGIAIGVSFADLGVEGNAQIFGVAVPLLAIFMTIAISIHNIPEGTAISIPLNPSGNQFGSCKARRGNRKPHLLTGAKRPFAWSVRPSVSRYPQGANGASRERVGWGGSH
jgi:zinc transporter, ZIP family